MNPGQLAQLPNLAPDIMFGFLLVLARAGGMVMLMPGFAEAEVPPMLRLSFSLVLAALLYPVAAPVLPPMPSDGAQVLMLVAGELLLGGLIGFLARLAVLALPAAGQVLSTMVGLSSVLQPDQAVGAQPTALSRLLGIAAPLLFLRAGLSAGPLAALVGSYATLPPGATMAGDDTAVVVAAVGGFFSLALRLAAPFLLAGTIWQIALGLLGRLVPQVQVWLLALPGQILGGLALLALFAGTMLAVWLDRTGALLATLPGH